MTVHSPQTTAHGEVIEIRPQVAPAQDGAVEAVPAYFTPDTLIDDLMDELAEAREMVVYLTRANEALAAQLESTLQDRKLILADRDRLRAASGDVIRETFSSYRQAEEAYAAHLKAEADNARLREALIDERTETLWNAYGTGMERDGRWRHMCMSDGEWLEFECGLDNSQPDHPADVVKAAIPLAAERFVAALVALKGETP